MKLNEAIETQALGHLKRIWIHTDKVLLTILLIFLLMLSAFSAMAQAPYIVSMSPSHLETGVDPNVGTLELTLSEPIYSNGANLPDGFDELNLRYVGGSTVQEFDIDGPNVEIVGNKIILSNVITLNYGQAYYIQNYTGNLGIVVDIDGNKLPDFNNSTTWAFTTRSSDLYIVSIYPDDNASFIDPTADEDFTITFNQNVYLNYTWWVQVRDDADTDHLGFSTGSSQYMEVSGNTITLKRRDIDLPFGENMHVYIPSTAFKDGNNRNFEGIAWGDHTTWNFTTKSEVTPPGIKNINPSYEEEGVDRSLSTFSIQFDESVSLDTKGSNVILYIKGKSGNTPIAATDYRGISNSEGYYHITFSGLEELTEGGEYFVSIPNDLFYDSQRNYFEGTDDTNWGFLANRKPTKISLSSNSVQENMPAGTVVGTVSATEPDYRDDATVTLVGGTHASSFQIVGNQLRTTEELDYEAGATRSITLRATDNAGEFLNSAVTINVGNVDDTPPSITAIDPEDEATNVDLTPVITFTFNEDVQAVQSGNAIYYLRRSSNNGSVMSWQTVDGVLPEYMTISGDQIMFEVPNALNYSTEYYFDGQPISDLAGNTANPFNYNTFTTRAISSEKEVLAATIPGIVGEPVIDNINNTITATVQATNPSRLEILLDVSPGATYSFSSNPQYYQNGVGFPMTLRAENNSFESWTITLNWEELAGTYTVGDNGTFATITDAVGQLGLAGMSGDVIFEVEDGYNVTKTVFLSNPDPTYNVTIKPQAGATQIDLYPESNYGSVLRINNAISNMIIDGADPSTGNVVMNLHANLDGIEGVNFFGSGDYDFTLKNLRINILNSVGIRMNSQFASLSGINIIGCEFVAANTETTAQIMGVDLNVSNISNINVIGNKFYNQAGAPDPYIYYAIVAGDELTDVINNSISIRGNRTVGISKGTNILHNSIHLYGSSVESNESHNAIGTGGNIQNNNVSITRISGSGSSKAFVQLSTIQVEDAGNNVYIADDGVSTTVYAQNAASQSAMSAIAPTTTYIDVAFTNSAVADLSLSGSSLSNNELRTSPVDGVNTDILGNSRSASWPSRGAYEVPNRASDFLTFSFAEQYEEAVINNEAHTVDISVWPETDVTNLAPTFTISPGASISPVGSGLARNFTNPLTYQITDEQEFAQQTWTVTVTEGDLPPQADAFSPGQGETQVLINASVSLGFDEPTTLGTGSIHLYKEGQLEESVDVTSPKVNHTSVTYNSVLNIEFTNEFEAETNYSILVDAGVVKDDMDQDFEGILSHDVWSFTTMDNESDAPVWNYEYPEDGMVDISAADLVEDGIYFEFNEPIRKGTGNIQIFNAANDQLIKTINVTDENNEVTDEGIDLYGVGLLPTSTEVYVLVCDGCITDILGNPYGGNSPGDWSFTTAGPRITGLSPADDAIQVGVEENLVITFNENVQYSGNSGSVSIYKSDDAPVETIYLNNSSKVSFLDNTLTVNPDAVLEGSTSYYVQITGTGIEGVDNSIEFNGLDDETTWTFTTVDNINPTITAFSPNIDDIKVPNNAPIVLTMSEPVQLSGNPNADIRIRNLSNPGTIYRTIDPASGQVIIEDNVVTIQPMGGMLSGAAEIEVYVGWSTTPFEDLVGNDLNELFNSDFKFTVDNLPPSMDTSSPENTATEVAVNVGQLSLTLSENVVAGAGSFELVTGADNVVKTFYMGTADVNVSGSTVTLNNVPLLSNLTTYWVRNNNTGANAIMDVANNELGSWTTNATWSFTTEEALIVSDFSTEAPVALDANLSVTYNKPVQEGTGSYYLRDGSGQLIETFAIDGPKVTINESTVTLNPDNNLIYHTNYRVEAFAGVVKDMSDRPSIELTSEDWVFNSVGIISTLSPADDATDVSPFADLVITFDAPVQVKTGGAFRVFRTADNQQLGNTWSFNSATVEGNTLTFNSPLDIEPGVDVYIDILGGIEDLDENPIDIRGNGTWNFTTVKQSQTVDFAALDTKTFGDGTYTFVAATASSGLAIEYSSDDEEVATVSGNQITIHGAGVTTITATQAGNTFYHDADSEQTLTVDKATKAITFTIPDKTYGDEIFTLSAVLTPTDDEITFQLTEGDDASLDSETNEVTILGAGSVTFTATSPESDNYLAATPVDYELDIQKKVLTARADNQSREYGESNPDLTLSFDGFIEGENASDLSGTLPSRTTEADENSSVGEYTITVAGGSDVNYEFQNENGTLTITKAELDTYAVSLIKNYGDDNPELELELVGFKNEETLAVINALPVVATQASKYSDAGNHVITVTGGEDDNYSFNYINGTLAIGKVALTATVQDVEKVYGQANPEFVIEYVGFVSGEDDASLDLPMVVTTTADENSNVGEYVLDLQDQEDTNYEINTIDGTLTITKAEQIVEIQDITDKVINATPFDIVASVNSDTELQYAVSGHATNSGKTITLTGTVGTVIVTVTAPASLNYLEGTEQIIFQVNDKQTQQITFNVEDQTYGGEVGLSGTSDSSLPVSYEIVSGPLALNNGVLSFTGVGAASVRALQSGDETYNEAEPVIAEFTIAKAALTVTADDQSITFGDEVPTLSFSYDGFVNEEDATALNEIPVASTLASESSDAGTYDISLSGGTADNYELILVKGTLTIEKAEATVTLSDLTFDEDGSAKSPTVVTDPADLTVVLTYDGASEAPSEAGTYEVVATIGETNYSGSATATLTINEVTVTGVQPTAVEIAVYPNPTTEWLAVSGFTDKLAQLSLIDIDGRVVLSQQVTPKEKVNVRSLKAGLYLLQLDRKDFTTTTKILIH
ncbi:MAG: Ig-like domain-containing protein [Reichenbachiella sp.]|uniref:Ig-like domain-containing protein n=1 Tax=Reichenbachiella sp. TaxID=2184521 RepID=UPI0029670958|nr:Ig-like domain-containing protein [Reichenbachiella sp.]MDW3209057.1 Ig-like domain-containing protein [Reichenbachiella sp.]